MNSISEMESFGHKTFWIVGGGQSFPKALRSENFIGNYHILTKHPKLTYFGEYYALL